MSDDSSSDNIAASEGPVEESAELNDIDSLARLEQLRAEHRRLDTDIKALHELGITDMLKIARLKKMKLRLKDRIAALEDKLTPDIIA